MSGIIRSWECLSARCGEQFDSWDSNPECPACKGVRVGWIPGGGHVQGTAKAADAELRALADVFNMTDMNSATRGERAKPKLPPPPVMDRHAQATQFAPGFTAAVPTDRAVCVPSSTSVNFKTTMSIGSALPHSRTVPGVHSNTRIEARHSGRA